MAGPKRQMKLGVSMRMQGYHSAAWRHPDAAPDATMTIGHFAEMTRIAEAAKFDMVFLADAYGVRAPRIPAGAFGRTQNVVGLEPLTILSALAMISSRIGLVATISTTFFPPYLLARQMASLDHISGGRAGWNLVTSSSDLEAQNFGLERHPGVEDRYARAAEFVQVVQGLWDSWEEDAFLYDRASGVIFDESKMHVLDHAGEYFHVRGPLNVPRPPQGRPVLFQAGASDAGQELAAATADAVYAACPTLASAQAYYNSVKGRMARHGRAPETLAVMPGVMPVIGATEQEARERFAQLQELLDPLVGLAMLADGWGDLSGLDLDGPVPPMTRQTTSRHRLYADLAKENSWSIRQLYEASAAGRGHHLVIGTVTQVADTLQEWFETAGADGFNILPAWSPGGFRDFAEQVVPELQRRGLFRTSYEGGTLRGHLGLGRPGWSKSHR